MFIAALTFVTALAVAQTTTPQQPPAPQTQAPQSPAQTAPAPGTAPQATLPSTPELPVLDARLGGCTADFTVKGPDGTPVYLALVHVRVRYGALGIKRMDLEVGTNSEGKARVKGLPDEARLMAWDITKDDKKTVVDQDVKKTCQGKFDVTLK
jgi:hypothetical protein